MFFFLLVLGGEIRNLFLDKIRKKEAQVIFLLTCLIIQLLMKDFEINGFSQDATFSYFDKYNRNEYYIYISCRNIH